MKKSPFSDKIMCVPASAAKVKTGNAENKAEKMTSDIGLFKYEKYCFKQN